MSHRYYSQRRGENKYTAGLPFDDVKALFLKLYGQLTDDGYFNESFGWSCVDSGYTSGSVRDVEMEMLLAIRKKELWPIGGYVLNYSEDDFFDVIEFLFQHISKPVDGSYHSWNECGMHWETFNKDEGQKTFRLKINELLAAYERHFELSAQGEVLERPEAGFEAIFDADLPTKDLNVVERINAAVLRYRRHGSTIDDRRQAVRDLADVLEYLRPQVQELLTDKDESDLFNIANNFGIRHHNDRQRTNYDTAIWLSWMFYFYLATIHVVLRKIDSQKRTEIDTRPRAALTSR